MSNMIPFIMSSSPPPIDDCEEDEDDEFGDFRVADDSFSLTDLNQCTESPAEGKSWVEITQKSSEEGEFCSLEIPISNKVINNVSSTLINCNIDNSSMAEAITFTQEPISKNEDTLCLFEDKSQLEDKDLFFENSIGEPQVNGNVQVSSSAKVESDKTHSKFFTVFNGAQDSNVDVVSEKRTEMPVLSERSSKFCDVGGIDLKETEVVSDDFSDFTEFSSGSSLNNIKFQTSLDCGESSDLKSNQLKPSNDIDDFDEFDDFESAEFKSHVVEKELTVEEILKMMFPESKEVVEIETDVLGLTDSLHSCLDDSSSVWGHLKELETSHALSYQWSNSAANKTLLSSLNIDSRNILFGGRWNLCVPRFAANLGVNPLEPVKATETTFPQPDSTAPSTSTIEDVVPVAQFDWTSSGLTNPLDGLEKENPTTAPEEATMSSSVDSMEVEPIKPIIDDIFGPINTTPEGEEETSVQPLSSLHNRHHQTTLHFLPEKKSEMSAEAYAVVESFPDLSFLSARKLMHAADENMSRWRVRP